MFDMILNTPQELCDKLIQIPQKIQNDCSVFTIYFQYFFLAKAGLCCFLPKTQKNFHRPIFV